jgi:tetratricopeptide (TPR) repeat protein
MYYLFINQDSTVRYSKLTEQMAREVRDYYLLGKIYQNYAFIYQANPEFYDRALEYYYLAQGQNVSNHAKVAEILTGIAELYEFNTEYGVAIENYNEAIERLEMVQDRASIADIKFQISRSHLKNSDTSAAIASMEESIAIWEELQRPEETFDILEQEYLIFMDKGDFEGLKTVVRRLTEVAMQTQNQQDYMARTILLEANMALVMEDYQEARELYRRARELSENTTPELNILSNALYGLAKLERERDSLNLALDILFEAEENYTRTDQNREGIIKVYDLIVDILFEDEDRDQLLSHYTKWLKMQVIYEEDRALVEKKNTNFSILQSYLDRQREQFQNPAQEARNVVWITVSLVLAGVATFFAIFFYRRYYREHHEAIKRKKALKEVWTITNKD